MVRAELNREGKYLILFESDASLLSPNSVAAAVVAVAVVVAVGGGSVVFDFALWGFEVEVEVEVEEVLVILYDLMAEIVADI